MRRLREKLPPLTDALLRRLLMLRHDRRHLLAERVVRDADDGRLLDRGVLDQRVLVVRLRSIGDTVLATPSLYALKRFLPNVTVDILVEDWVAPLLNRTMRGSPFAPVTIAHSLCMRSLGFLQPPVPASIFITAKKKLTCL